MRHGILIGGSLACLISGCLSAVDEQAAKDQSNQSAWVSQGEVTVVPGTDLLQLEHRRGALFPFAANRPNLATVFSQWTDPLDIRSGHAMIRLDSPIFLANAQLNRFGETFTFNNLDETNVRVEAIASVHLRPCPGYIIEPRTGRMKSIGMVQGQTDLYNRERDYDWVSWQGQLVAVPIHCTQPFDHSRLIQWGHDRDLTRRFRLLGRDDRPITFGWEVESSNTDIVNFYRLQEYSDDAWLALPYSERAALLRAELKYASEHGVDYQQIKTTKFKKMDHAPSYWSTDLTAENAYIWELISIPVNTVAEMVQQLQSVRLFNGNTHIHLAFEPPGLTDETTITRFKTLFILGNLYVLLRAYGDQISTYGGRAAAFTNVNLNPLEERLLNNLDHMLRNLQHPANLELKWHMLGYRVISPYPGMLHGLEVRGLGKNIEDQLELAWRLLNALEDLGRPVRLHTGASMDSGYMLDDMTPAASDLLEAVFIPQCVGIVDALKCRYTKRRDQVRKVFFNSKLTVTSHRLDLPYHRWELLGLLAPATQGIQATRSAYEQRTIEIIQTTDRSVAGGHELMAYRWLQALIDWATASRLWEYF